MNNMKCSWILTCQFPFKEMDDFPGNALNENMPVSKSYNGQELPYNIGNYLSYLMLREGLETQSENELQADGSPVR